jgi:3-oxoacyl-[acyl-carrier-protein] synthase-3
MIDSLEALTAHLLDRLRQVEENLGGETSGSVPPSARFADRLDSMGLVEFLDLVAEDCGVMPAQIEACVGRQFTTVVELAEALAAAGLLPRGERSPSGGATPQQEIEAPSAGELSAIGTGCWLAATAVRLPATVQSAAVLNAALHRPDGWLERRANLQARRVWADQDPLAAAAEAGQECLATTDLLREEIGALLVTSEAPPLLTGLAAALHHRLDLRPETVALEIGGACTGFLAALWTARALLPRVGPVLVLAVEASSHLLHIQPGPPGEAAVLFGDGAAACILCDRALSADSVAVRDVILGSDGKGRHLVQVERTAAGRVEVQLDGRALAGRAVRAMAQVVGDLVRRYGIALSELTAVVAHGGNGRLPALLARRLGLPPERVWSETARTGNLGSVSLPAAWAAHSPFRTGPVAWTAVGAGLTWGAALTGSMSFTGRPEG